MKRLLILLVPVLLLACLPGCNTTEELNPNAPKSRIALIAKNDASYFWQVVFAGARSAAVEYGIEVDVYAPETEDDYQTQIEMIGAAVENNYDAIVFSACDFDKVVPAIEAAMDAGVQVVTIDSGIGTGRNVVFIGTDSTGAGYLAGQALAQFAGTDANVGIISFEEFSKNGMERNEGFLAFLAENPDMELVDLRFCESNREDPYNQTLEMLREHPEINAIATFNEWTTLGVGDAIDAAGLKDEVVVVAFDNNEDSVALLEKGVINALVVQNPFAMGYLGVEHALSQIAGNKPEETTIYTDSVVITQENMFTPQNQKLLFPFAQ